MTRPAREPKAVELWAIFRDDNTISYMDLDNNYDESLIWSICDEDEEPVRVRIVPVNPVKRRPRAGGKRRRSKE